MALPAHRITDNEEIVPPSMPFVTMNKRVLLVNKFYYTRGGAEVVAINLYDLLTQNGYDVAVFTMDYPDTIQAPNVFTTPEVSFKTPSTKDKINFARRTLGGYRVVEDFKRVLKEFKPAVVHLHNIHSYISPVVGQIARDNGCRVVWTLHDYKLICPAYSCLNRGNVCERCFINKARILSQRCFKESLAASSLAFLEAMKWNRRRLEKFTHAFICPSSFMREQMIKGGFNAHKLHVVNNFIDPVKLRELKALPHNTKDEYYTYIGRLSSEKGLDTLLKAARNLPYKLKIAGGGPLKQRLISDYQSSNIEFLGRLTAEEISRLLSRARLLVQPSEWYENNPLSTIEALCAGVPVVGAQIGGIPELINPFNGLTFTWGDQIELERCIKSVMSLNYPFNYDDIAREAQARFSGESHLEKLEKIYFE